MQGVDELMQWVGRKEFAVDHVTVPSVQRLAAMLDRNEPTPKNGDPLPIGWYLILFPRVVRQSQLGRDGTPKLGDFLPPVSLPRRMLAGKRTTFIDDLRVGDEVRREATIKTITPKTGRTGQMVFFTIRTDISSPRGLAIVEEADIVYRGNPHPNTPQPPAPAAPPEPVWKKVVKPDAVLLFRYSALTFNGHRIHYDYPYVSDVEGYAERVVNGGLTTLLLFELARSHAATPVKSLSARAMRPVFVDQTIVLCGKSSADEKSAMLWAEDTERRLVLSATAELA